MSKIKSFVKEHFLLGVTLVNSYWFIDFTIGLLNKSATPFLAFSASIMGVISVVGWITLFSEYEDKKFQKRLAVIRGNINERK